MFRLSGKRQRFPSGTDETVIDKEEKTTLLPCGCRYQDQGSMVVRIKECPYHRRRRTTKRPYRPKAECVKP